MGAVKKTGEPVHVEFGGLRIGLRFIKVAESYELLLGLRRTDSIFDCVRGRFAASWRGLAAMAGHEARRAFCGNRIASGMDQGWPEASVASQRHRVGIFHAIRSWRKDLPAE